MQNKQVTCLILLDLSSAFDTISHSKLINRLKFIFGLDGVVLDWITDYLANHTQHVVIKQDNFLDSATSSPNHPSSRNSTGFGPWTKSVQLVHFSTG